MTAALAEFTEKGYEAATVADIAERAGVTTGALYAHFRGKLDLLLETLGLRRVDDFARDVFTAAQSRPGAEMSLMLGREMARPPATETLLLLDVIVLARRDARLAATMRRLLGIKMEELERASDAGRETGVIDPDLSPKDLARVLALIAFGKMVLAAIDEQPPTQAAFVRITDALHWRHPPAQGGPDATALAAVAARSAESQRARLDFEAAVVDAVEQGHSLRQVGDAAGVSHEQIRRIVAAPHRPT